MDDRTVIVVGAGASAEFNLPLGRGLAKKIGSDANFEYDWFPNRLKSGNPDLFAALNRACETHYADVNMESYIAAGKEIAAAMREASSIDSFIHSRDGDKAIEIVAKLGIVNSILREEKHSKLWYEARHVQDTIRFDQIQDTWLPKLTNLIWDGVPKAAVRDRLRQVTLIIFNYDRCVEHYLLHSLKNYYPIDDLEAQDILQDLSIIHPYGTVGYLPWELVSPAVEFGDSVSTARLLQAVAGIRTFTEQLADDQLTDHIKSSVGKSSLMIFLGFAFHKQNVELLTPRKAGNQRQVFATALNMSKPVADMLERKLASTFSDGRPGRVSLDSDCTCGDLFDKYGALFGE